MFVSFFYSVFILILHNIPTFLELDLYDNLYMFAHKTQHRYGDATHKKPDHHAHQVMPP